MQHDRRSRCILVSGRTASCCLVLHVRPAANDNTSTQAGFSPNMCCNVTGEPGWCAFRCCCGMLAVLLLCILTAAVVYLLQAQAAAEGLPAPHTARMGVEAAAEAGHLLRQRRWRWQEMQWRQTHLRRWGPSAKIQPSITYWHEEWHVSTFLAMPHAAAIHQLPCHNFGIWHCSWRHPAGNVFSSVRTANVTAEYLQFPALGFIEHASEATTCCCSCDGTCYGTTRPRCRLPLPSQQLEGCHCEQGSSCSRRCAVCVRPAAATFVSPDKIYLQPFVLQMHSRQHNMHVQPMFKQE
jgi:hypothetical protein